MILLDLFCGAGGAAMGYHRAGWEVVGVDIRPQPDYPFEFIQGDVFDLPEVFLRGFDAVHASPPCQGYSVINRSGKGVKRIPEVVDLLARSAKRWVVENVLGAKNVMPEAIQLHGGHFGLDIWRPRLFASFNVLVEPPQRPRPDTEAGVYGRPGIRTISERRDGSLLEQATVEQARRLLGIDWCDDWDGLREAIPPIYTELIGLQLLGRPWEHLVVPMPPLECSDCRGDRFDMNDRYCRPCRAKRMRRYRNGNQAN